MSFRKYSTTLSMFAALLVCLGLTACASKEDKAVQATVKVFNKTLIEAFVKPNPDLMADVATEKEQQKIGLYIVNLIQKRQIMKCSLNSISFGPVKYLSADKAQVTTSEDWTFEYLDYNTRKTVAPPKKIHYSVTYSLVMGKGDWLVDELKIEKEK